MPKQKITKDNVLAAAFELLREKGEPGVLVNSIAERLGCSVQPIYSYCKNIDSLKAELAQKAGCYMGEYIQKKLDESDLFNSTGKAYISFAKNEPGLFSFYFLRDRKAATCLEDIYQSECNPQIAVFLAQTLGISHTDAVNLHINMMIFTNGLSFMLTSPDFNLSEEEINARLEQAYTAFINNILRR